MAEEPSSLQGLKDTCNTMMFGQAMSGVYEKYDMASMPDAAAAIRKTCGTAVGMSEMSEILGKCVGKDGMVQGDLEDAKASAMAVFVLAGRLAVESYTALRLIGEKSNAAKTSGGGTGQP